MTISNFGCTVRKIEYDRSALYLHFYRRVLICSTVPTYHIIVCIVDTEQQSILANHFIKYTCIHQSYELYYSNARHEERKAEYNMKTRTIRALTGQSLETSASHRADLPLTLLKIPQIHQNLERAINTLAQGPIEGKKASEKEWWRRRRWRNYPIVPALPA